MFYAASFGGIPLLVASIETDRGRDVAVQSPSIGDRHTVRVRGLKHRIDRCELLFIDQPGRAPYRERAEAFIALAESSDTAQQAQIFTHPLDGSFRAFAGELQRSTDNQARQIRVSCTFHEVAPPTNVLPIAGGTNPAAGVESVAVAGAAASSALTEVEIAGDLDAEAAAARPDGIKHAAIGAIADLVSAWRDAGDALDSQQVFLEVSEAVADVDALVDELELLQDITRWQAYRDVMRLRYEVTRAGEAFTASARSTFDLFVEPARPLLAICAEIYGAAAARDRAAEVAKNNRLRTPGLVPIGTLLKMPAVTR